MSAPQILTQPTRPLGTATVVIALLCGVFAYGQEPGRLGAIVVLVLPVVILAAIAMKRAGIRSWLFLLASWALGVLAAGYLLPG